MRLIIQRVKSASVTISGQKKAEIGVGLLILLGIEKNDQLDDVEWLTSKIVNFRVFNDHDHKMNLSLLDIHGEVLVVSQFTLHASTKKGTRPGFSKSAPPDKAYPLYLEFINRLQEKLSSQVESGQFGAMMEVGLVNDGPVTFFIDSRFKE